MWGLAGRLCACVGGVVVVGSGVATAGSPAPFTDEAIARGLVFEMYDYPQSQGDIGFGCGFADFDQDGDPDIMILGGACGHVFADKA